MQREATPSANTLDFIATCVECIRSGLPRQGKSDKLLYLVRNVPIVTSVEMAPVAPIPVSPIPSCEEKGFGACGGFRQGRAPFLRARRRAALTGFAASSTIVPGGNGSFAFQ